MIQTSSKELLKQAQDYCDEGKWDKAIAHCYQAIQNQPRFAIAYLTLGNALASQERIESAIRAYSRAIDLDPCLVDAHVKRGNLHLKRGSLDEATACYQKAIALDPNLGIAYLNLSKILHQKGRVDEAIAYQQKAIEVQPGLIDAETYLNLGDDLFWRGHKDKGIAYYRRAVALKPDWLEAWKHLSHQLYNAGRFVEARETFQVFVRRQHELAKLHQLERLGIRLLTQEWTLYIGHMALLDYYVKMGLLGLRPSVNSILISLQNKVVNSTYLQYWHQYLSVVSNPSLIQQLSPWARYLEDYVSMAMLSDGRVEDYLTHWVATQRQWDEENRSPLLSLSSSDTERGWKCLRDFGVSETEWFVAVHVRESGYKRENPNAYVSARNANIDMYLLAFQSIVERGGWVIRMGDPTMKPLPQMERIIDYAHSPLKSDWMDVFLWAKCRFFIGTASGPCSVPPTFGVPCVLTNFHLCPLPFSEDIFIPKLLWSEHEARYLTFLEQANPPFYIVELVSTLNSLGVKLVDNTPEEINDLVLEMLDRLDETFEYTEEDKSLHEQFSNLLSSSSQFSCGTNSRIGRNFLRKYKNLLLPLEEDKKLE